MASNITLTMIKPDAVAAGHSGKIIDMIIQAGFKVQAMKLTRLSTEKAQEFYAVHSARPFFGDLVKFMTEGPIIAAVLEKDNAVEDFRKLIGATNPANAEEGTIRKALLQISKEMRCTDLTVMKMQLLKLHSTLQE
jgi:nucleoside-diphosphate kinase